MTNKTPRPIYEVTIPHPGYDPSKPKVAFISLYFDEHVSEEERAQQIVAWNQHQNPNPDVFNAKVLEIRRWAKKNKIACHFAGIRWSNEATVEARWWDESAASMFKLEWGGAQ